MGSFRRASVSLERPRARVRHSANFSINQISASLSASEGGCGLSDNTMVSEATASEKPNWLRMAQPWPRLEPSAGLLGAPFTPWPFLATSDALLQGILGTLGLSWRFPLGRLPASIFHEVYFPRGTTWGQSLDVHPGLGITLEVPQCIPRGAPVATLGGYSQGGARVGHQPQ